MNEWPERSASRKLAHAIQVHSLLPVPPEISKAHRRESEDVPQVDLKRLNDALDAWEARALLGSGNEGTK